MASGVFEMGIGKTGLAVALALAAGISGACANQTNEQKPVVQPEPASGKMEVEWVVWTATGYDWMPGDCAEKYTNGFGDMTFCKFYDGTARLYINDGPFCKRVGCNPVGGGQ